MIRKKEVGGGGGGKDTEHPVLLALVVVFPPAFLEGTEIKSLGGCINSCAYVSYKATVYTFVMPVERKIQLLYE